jgi:hypothetical protein
MDRARSWLGRERRDPAPADTAVATLSARAREPALRPTRAGGGSRRVLFAVVAVLGAASAVAALVVWRSGLDVGSPRHLLRQRLGPTAPSPTPPRPAASATPRAPSNVAPPPPTVPLSSPAAASAVPSGSGIATPPAAAPTGAPNDPAPVHSLPAAGAQPDLALPAGSAAQPDLALPAGFPALIPTASAPATVPSVAARVRSTPTDAVSTPSSSATLASSSSGSAAPSRLTSTAALPTRAAAVARAPRFAIEFGPFVSAADAERVERRLIEAGYATVRSRARSGASAYAVLIERVPTVQEAKTIAATLRERGLGEAVVVSTDPVVLRVGAPLALRGAVELAERVRTAGHTVRVAAQPGEAPAFIVRHGAFASRDEAEARHREIGQLELPAHQVVQVP